LAKITKPEDADDGMFWIGFNDYVKFFYISTICISTDETIVSRTVCDMHEEGGFGIAKITVP